MGALPGIFSLLVAAAGWHYLFYSNAAKNLVCVEDEPTNLLRARLRRIGGFTLLLLAILFFAGFYSVDARRSPAAFLAIWIGVFALLFLVVLLALMDVRLTAKLKKKRPKPPQTP